MGFKLVSKALLVALFSNIVLSQNCKEVYDALKVSPSEEALENCKVNSEGNVTNLDLTDASDFSADSISKIPASVKDLTFGKYTFGQDHINALGKLTNLESLYLNTNISNDLDFSPLENLKKLTTLTVSNIYPRGAFEYSDFTYNNILSHLPSLKKLNVQSLEIPFDKNKLCTVPNLEVEYSGFDDHGKFTCPGAAAAAATTPAAASAATTTAAAAASSSSGAAATSSASTNAAANNGAAAANNGAAAAGNAAANNAAAPSQPIVAGNSTAPAANNSTATSDASSVKVNATLMVALGLLLLSYF